MDKLIKEISFIGGDTLAMDNQYAQFNCFNPSTSNQQLCTMDTKTTSASSNSNGFGTMSQWGIMSSVGDTKKFVNGVYRKALIRVDPYNDGDIISNLNNIENTFDLVSTSCSIIGYNGNLVEFHGIDYRIKYKKAQDLCGNGVKYKCFIGMKCDKNLNSGKVSWISNNAEITNQDILNNYFAESGFTNCDGTSNLISNSNVNVYYYFLDGSDGKIRRTSFDYNLKDIRMGICEIGESQLICNKALFVYAQIHDLSIESALNHYYIHGHKHDNIWPGHLCHPTQSKQPINTINSQSIPYMKVYVDDKVQQSQLNNYCEKKCEIDPFCSSSIAGRTGGKSECLFQTTFDPKYDYDININNNAQNKILSGIPVIESALIGWNCKSSLFEKIMQHKISYGQQQQSEVITIRTGAYFKSVIENKFMDVGFIWITYINLNSAQHRTMTKYECIYLCYQHRSCVIAAYSLTTMTYCILYGAKLELPDYHRYINYEKCYVDHLGSCVYLHNGYVSLTSLNLQEGLYHMNRKTIQGGLRQSSFKIVPSPSQLNQTIYNQTTKIYYQYATNSESFCKTQCSQLQTCSIYAYHDTLFNRICFILVTDSRDQPSGDWNTIDFNPNTINFHHGKSSKF